MKRWLTFIFTSIIAVLTTGCGFVWNDVYLRFSPALNQTTVFMGDSITQHWQLPEHNSGISGQTTSQMRARFPANVLGHGYARVIILGGTNNVGAVSYGTGPIIADLDAMASTARDAGIEPVLALIPPLFTSPTSNGNPEVPILNDAIAALATAKGYKLIDYNTPMLRHPEMFRDGVHPSLLGYAVMEDALARVVTQ